MLNKVVIDSVCQFIYSLSFTITISKNNHTNKQPYLNAGPIQFQKEEQIFWQADKLVSALVYTLCHAVLLYGLWLVCS